MRRKTPRKRHVYIIHAGADKALAGYLKSRIQEIRGTTVFVASRAGDIPTGKPWLATIHRNMRDATTFVALLTPRSITRHWVFYEAGAAWYSGLHWLPIVAGGVDRNTVPLPLGVAQVLALDEPDGATQLFKDLNARLDDAPTFCATVKALALPPPNDELETERAQLAEEAFGGLGPAPRIVLKRMLTIGGITHDDMRRLLTEAGYPADSGDYVERILKSVRDSGFVQGSFEGRWSVKPEMQELLARCLTPPSLPEKLRALALDLEQWIQRHDGQIDMLEFEKRFRERVRVLTEKAERDHGEGDGVFKAVPSGGTNVRRIIKALREVADKVPVAAI
jgi:TIR domain